MAYIWDVSKRIKPLEIVELKRNAKYIETVTKRMYLPGKYFPQDGKSKEEAYIGVSSHNVKGIDMNQRL